MCAQLSAVCSKRPKTPGCRCWGSSHFLAKYAFKWLAPSRLEIRIGAGVHFVELTCGGIRLHLLVPLVLGQGMQFGHQLAVFARRELGNGFPNFGDCGHARTLQNVSKRGKSNQGPDDRQSYARSHSRADHLANFISLIFRCSVRRLMPSFLAAAVTLPLVAASACIINFFPFRADRADSTFPRTPLWRSYFSKISTMFSVSIRTASVSPKKKMI